MIWATGCREDKLHAALNSTQKPYCSIDHVSDFTNMTAPHDIESDVNLILPRRQKPAKTTGVLPRGFDLAKLLICRCAVGAAKNHMV
jgi:hypothetical protein